MSTIIIIVLIALVIFTIIDPEMVAFAFCVFLEILWFIIAVVTVLVIAVCMFVLAQRFIRTL